MPEPPRIALNLPLNLNIPLKDSRFEDLPFLVDVARIQHPIEIVVVDVDVFEVEDAGELVAVQLVLALFADYG